MAFNTGEGGDDTPMSDINVTPLVDVMLVLLIVFMITMPVLTHSIQINLPTATETQEQPKQETKPINVAVDAAGKYAIGEENSTTADLDVAALKQKLVEIAKNNPEAVVAISADNETPYENVARVLEAAKEAGIGKVGFRYKVETAK